MSNAVFDSMITDFTSGAFKDFGAKKVSRTEYELFLKEFVFEKLKGKRLGQAFAERFDIRDRMLSNYVSDDFATDHIKRCEYIK